MPKLLRAVDIGEGDGSFHVLTRVWSNDDAGRCLACPRSQCTFEAGSEGTGTCVGIYPGRFDPSGPPTPVRPPLRVRG